MKSSVLIATVVFQKIEPFLKDYFSSIKKQSDKDFDLLIVNDGLDEQYLIPYPEYLKLNNIYWKNFFKKMKLKYYVFNFLKNCKKNGLKVNIVTDFTLNIQLRKIKKLKIEKYISFVTSSEECGLDKPDKLIFLKAIKKLKVNKKNICLIGDDFNKDIKGAVENKIFAFWLTKKQVYKKNVGIKFDIFSNFKQLDKKIFF